MVKVAAAIPARNEQKAIASVVLLAKEQVNEVLVIDDGSSDRTAILAKLSGAKVVTHQRTRGKGAGIMTALRWAEQNKVDILVVLDGDGQHDPGEIPKLVEPIMNAEADITIGSRWHHDEGRKEMPLHRILGNWVLSTATSMALSRMIHDSQSGFRAFHKRTFASLKQAMETGFAVESEMIALADRSGFKWTEVGVKAGYDGLDTSTQGSWTHGLTVLSKVMRVLRINKPIRFFSLLACLCMAFALIVYSFSNYMYPEADPLPLGSMYIIASCVIVGAFLVFSGVMLSSVNRVSDRILGIMLDMRK